MKQRVLEYVSPAQWSGNLITLIALAVGSAIAVLVIEYVGSRLEQSS